MEQCNQSYNWVGTLKYERKLHVIVDRMRLAGELRLVELNGEENGTSAELK